MFTNLQLLITWILTSMTRIWTVALNNWGCIGVCIIGFPILRKLVTVFRKIF